jgi:hypothetical protein
MKIQILNKQIIVSGGKQLQEKICAKCKNAFTILFKNHELCEKCRAKNKDNKDEFNKQVEYELDGAMRIPAEVETFTRPVLKI